ncbi:MAG TPA: hypothetical protein VFU76_13005 [Terriglobales bacterium]|nr:hypothetical protein [Terriglobales bacterium]
MVAKCANPACSREFHYLGDGRLFIGEVRTGESPRRHQYAWLCGQCAGQMTVVFDRDSGKPSVIEASAA